MNSLRKLLAHLPWTRSGPYVMVGGGLVVRPAHPHRYADLPIHPVDPGRLDAYFSAASTDPAVVVRVSPMRVLGLRTTAFKPYAQDDDQSPWVVFDGTLFRALGAIGGPVTRYHMMTSIEPDALVAKLGPRVVGVLLPTRLTPTRGEFHTAQARALELRDVARTFVDLSPNPFLSVTTEA